MPHPLVDLDLPSGVLNVCYEESQCGEIIHSTKESGTAAVVDGSSDVSTFTNNGLVGSLNVVALVSFSI